VQPPTDRQNGLSGNLRFPSQNFHVDEFFYGRGTFFKIVEKSVICLAKRGMVEISTFAMNNLS
jgi:hypothetical protein